jgi:hypothetical protein
VCAAYFKSEFLIFLSYRVMIKKRLHIEKI